MKGRSEKNSKTGMKSFLKRTVCGDRPVLWIGGLLLLMEIWKQLVLWLAVGRGQYNVWYFPFQLCSMPMYLSVLYGLLRKRKGRRAEALKRAIMTFLQDYGFLGGVLTLIVHDGLLHPGHPLLTAHGFLWHILMVICALYIHRSGLAGRSGRDFLMTVPIFCTAALIAEGINTALHPYGDCDMFYISPYHLSSQPVFHNLDLVLGRPAGILLYLLCMLAGAFLVHVLFSVHPVKHNCRPV